MPSQPSAFILVSLVFFLNLIFLYTHYFHPDVSLGILVFLAIVCSVYTQLILGFVAMTFYNSSYQIDFKASALAAVNLILLNLLSARVILKHLKLYVNIVASTWFLHYILVFITLFLALYILYVIFLWSRGY